MTLYSFVDKEKFDPANWSDTDITPSRKKLKKETPVSYVDDDTDIWR